ncbi:MAG: hypothetical protein K5696_10885, partial [Lachnospiraceae bacterium]|nr:hypothetical protein [Lachnospiraceae bacterium]
VFPLGESARFTIHYGYLKNVTHSAAFTGFLKIADEIHRERMKEAVSGNPVQMGATEECS